MNAAAFLAVAVLSGIGFALLQSGWAKNELRDRLDFGAVLLPTGPTALNASMSFQQEAVQWARTPFRRIERAGIDLLVFLSF